MKITVKEMKCGEALSPKMQARQKVKQISDLFNTFHGFKMWGPGFLDLYNGGKFDYPIAVPGDAANTEDEAKALAAKRFNEFDDYISWTVELIPEGGPNGEDMWFPCVAFKPSILQLDLDDVKFVFGEVADAIDKAMGYKGKQRESNEEISSKLQDRLKFKEFAPFYNELPFFGQTIGDPLDTVRKEGLGYGVGNGSKEEQEEAAKDILSDFDDYVSWTTDQDTDGSWYIKMTFKPELWALPIEELKKVFGLLDDAFGPWS